PRRGAVLRSWSWSLLDRVVLGRTVDATGSAASSPSPRGGADASVLATDCTTDSRVQWSAPMCRDPVRPHRSSERRNPPLTERNAMLNEYIATVREAQRREQIATRLRRRTGTAPPARRSRGTPRGGPG